LIYLFFSSVESFFDFSDEELLIKDTDRKTLFDELDSPTKTDHAGLKEKKVHVQKVNDLFLVKVIRKRT